MKLLPKPAPLLLLLLPLAIPAPSVDRLATLHSATHPPALPLRPVLLRVLPASVLSSCPPLLDSLLSRLLASHSPTPLALSLFRYALSLPSSSFCPSPASLSTALLILSRARRFASALSLLRLVARSRPSLLRRSHKPLSLLLSFVAKFRSFDAALRAFALAERAWALAGAPFGPDHFNALLRAFCARGRVAEARALFRRFHPRFPPDSRTLNTLLLGFKESRNLHALDLFYHDMLLRGFRPDSVTYCIRIDAYCKKGRFSDALELFDEMAAKQNCSPTVETITTLIYGAGIVKNPSAARRLFDEMGERGLTPDRGAHNALMGAYARVRDLTSAMAIMGEMEQKGIGVDDVSYNTMFCGFKRVGDLEGLWKLYKRMLEREFVPRTRTVMLLMKVFCENGRPDLGLELWDYLVGKGSCPHRHALDLLVTGLCCRGGVAEAYRCFMQVVERGRAPSERAFGVLEGFLTRAGEMEKVEELGQMMKSLQQPLEPSECEME
ncbi:pentatricopeptide repeat-containing protein At3g61360 [Ananas comosus]|uniref:Pentatricopeptide repeat-containing protein At3g61360 n=1 Tax=Ananas comosus TaxID=4615 RepID=A0A6P5F2N2_ANACO|nr:pentatricopeptide repeat-containing protein At3g61360 [Ananas comosus]